MHQSLFYTPQPHEAELRGRLLTHISRGTAATAALYLALGWLPPLRSNLHLYPWDGIFILTLALLCAFAARRYQPSFAASWLVASISILATYEMQYYGVRHPITALYLVSIVVAGMLIGGWFLRLWAGMGIFFVILWSVGEVNGRALPTAAYPLQTAEEAILWIALWSSALVIVGWLVWLFARHLEEAVLEAVTHQNNILAERSRMAREIHDTLAQGFTGIVIQLEAAEDGLQENDPEAAVAHLGRARALARTSLAEARRSVWALRPEVLEERDLPTALRLLAEQMGAQTAVAFQLEGIPRPLPPAVEDALLRIGQEGVTNAIRHAKATAVTIALAYQPAAVQLRVADNGRGFDPTQTPSSNGQGGFGLTSMRERATNIGGQLPIASQPHNGTTITLNWQ